MSKIEIVKFLIQEVEEEQKMFKEYDKIVAEARIKGKYESGGYWKHLSSTWGDKRVPRKSRIKNNCTKIRQLMLDIKMEASKLPLY